MSTFLTSDQVKAREIIFECQDKMKSLVNENKKYLNTHFNVNNV
jgi:hypothetical protein